MTESNKNCVVCHEKLTTHTYSEYPGDPMHLIAGPGSKNQMKKVTKTWCEKCGLLYINGGGV